jgi:hypothetical protein
MFLCVYSVFVSSCVGRGLATGSSPVQGVLPTKIQSETKSFTRIPYAPSGSNRSKDRQSFRPSQWPRGVKNENCLRPLKHWDRGFESHSRHGCLCAFILCFVLFCVWRANPPFKESYRLCIGLRNWKSGQGPTKVCSAIERQRDR